RAERGRALIEPVLGPLVGEPVVEVRDVVQLLGSGTSSRPNKKPHGLTPDAERAITHAYLDQHYMTVLDQRVPMLGNVSPRKAAKTEKGREKLVDWLKFMENSAAKNQPGSPMADYDFGWVWQALGISHLRK